MTESRLAQRRKDGGFAIAMPFSRAQAQAQPNALQRTGRMVHNRADAAFEADRCKVR
jgi:hypothetical protein